MHKFKKLPSIARAYVSLVVILGTLTLVHSVFRLYSKPLDEQWLILAALTLLTGSFSVKVSSINAYISVSEPFVFASVLLFGVEAGTVTVLLESLVILFWMGTNGRPFYRLIFNIAAPALAIWLSGQAFFVLSGGSPYSEPASPPPGLPQLFVPLLAFTAIYFLLSSWLVAIAVGLENRTAPSNIWWKNFAWLSVNYLSGGSIAALIVTYTHRLELSTLVIIVPFLVVSYLTFKTAMGRAEDSFAHVTQLNRLYLSTIETLAMAIDAKDQITHGHIRRVQAYAVGLAQRVGVSDEKLIKAIEAAALLHDMGKLAVPEHILNKPGKLTGAEFEKMKLHASVGADILSAIDFPYPVVPIVRHHHENWDGSGYPTGLKGTEIPIGARILSVVDCFDALTSDRPYRPRLSDQAAIDILLERRATMYDPLVVDTFVRTYQELVKTESSTAVEPAVFDIRSSTQGAFTNEVNASSARFADLRSLFPTFEKTRHRLQSSSLLVFLYDIQSDAIEVRFASGEWAQELENFRIPRGHRLSGWVAANRQTIVNSDPALDIGDVVRARGGLPRNCVSTPVIFGDQLVGVLTLYTKTPDGYTDGDRIEVEALARHIAEAIQVPVEAAS